MKHRFKNDIVFFALKFAVFLVPLVVLLLIYLVLDPFKVIRRYDFYYTSGRPSYVTLNRGYVSTCMFDKNYSRFKYDSFILGNSRSIFYEVKDWGKYLDAQGSNASCFHFDASGETLYGIFKKIKYIDNSGKKVKNMLLVIDWSVFSEVDPPQGHLFITPPRLMDNENLFQFHFSFLKAFYTLRFFEAYVDFRLSGTIKDYMKTDFLLDDRPFCYDVNTNELSFVYFEKMIEQNEKDYYNPSRMKVFHERSNALQYANVCIGQRQMELLEEIKEVLLKHDAAVKIIMSPIYDQKKLNPVDLDYLKRTFGDDNVFDFSGINSFTSDYRNYYEDSHYRPHVAREILKLVYEK